MKRFPEQDEGYLAASLRELTELRGGAASHRYHSIAVLLPMSGVTGIVGPSSIAAAQLAVSEINQSGGIDGRKLDAVFLNCDVERIADLENELDGLIQYSAISGIVNMSLSEARERLNKFIAGRIPHVFTSPYDGNEYSPNVYTIGSTPGEQFAPAIRRMAELFHVRRWAMVGKNNVWPHPSSLFARRCIAETGGQIVYEKYLPFGIDDADTLFDDLTRSKPDAVFLSLSGQDAVEFNRTFGRFGLDQKMLRLTEVVEENMLLAIGPENAKDLLAIGSYFATLDTDAHFEFGERYYAMHGNMAPPISALGQSIYEGINFYVALTRQRSKGLLGPIAYQSARGGMFHSNRKKDDPVYLAQADGAHFEVLEKLSK